MRKQLIVPILTLTFCAHASGSDKIDCNNLVGTWESPNKRTIIITQQDSSSGQIQGIYQLPAHIDKTAYALVGWTNNLGPNAKPSDDTAISVTVSWGDLTSISSWIGTCSSKPEGSELKLISHQVRLDAQPENERISTTFHTFSAKNDSKL